MKGSWAITFPVVDVAAAHPFSPSLDSSRGCKRHQVAMTLPTSVWMKALNTAGTAASDMDEQGHGDSPDWIKIGKPGDVGLHDELAT